MQQQAVLSREATAIAEQDDLDLSKKPRFGETLVKIFLFFCGFTSIFTTLGIVFVLGSESLHLFTDTYTTDSGESFQVSVVEFFTSTTWQPSIQRVGIWPLLTATLEIALISLLVAVPLGLGAAIYLSEYASPRSRAILKPILEVLAGIPTVVYGYFALTFMTPLLQNVFGKGIFGSVYNMASAGIVMGIMIIPLIASMSEDALSAVPRVLREGAYGLGSTRLETIIKVVLPSAFSGIVAAVILAMSRAVGETMIVAIAAGAGPNFTFDPTEAAQTMTGYIAAISTGDTPRGSVEYNSIFAIGLVLFLITLSLNMISRYVVSRVREAYE